MCQLKYHSIFPHFLQDSSSFIRYPEFATQSLKFCFKGASTAASTVPTTGSTAQSSSQSPPDITSTVSTPESTHNPTQTTTTVIATDTTHTSTVSTPGAPTQGPSSTTTPDSGGKHMCFMPTFHCWRTYLASYIMNSESFSQERVTVGLKF